MSIEQIIKTSEEWAIAARTQDRHFLEDSRKITLADHLQATYDAIQNVLNSTSESEFVRQLHTKCQEIGIERTWLEHVLKPAALLHDLGKVREDKNKLIMHPFTGEPKPLRHPLASLLIAHRLIPADYPYRKTILHLIEEHDTPFSWYRNWQTSKVVTKLGGWVKLNNKIAEKNGHGIILLCIFKLLDTQGHEEVEDAIWFIRNANETYLKQLNLEIPVPTSSDIRKLLAGGGK